MDQIVEKRLNTVRDIYFNLDRVMTQLPLPEEVLKRLKKIILEDDELKRIMQGLEEDRPPRFLIVGRTGVGKSSLINAICGFYTAEVSDVTIGTKAAERKTYYEGNRALMEILDSRGIGESTGIHGELSAERELQKEISDLMPDAILFVSRCKARDRLDKDIIYVRNLQEAYKRETGIQIPVIVVLNQVDEMEPSSYKNPEKYPHRKLENIQRAEEEFKKLLSKNRLNVIDLVSVSSLIDWGYSSEEISQMTIEERENLNIKEDGRYNIEKLIDILEKNIEVDAAMGLLKAGNEKAVLHRIAMKLVKCFSGISSVVASVPIPCSDILLLFSIQICMVVMISYISGENISVKTAKKFVSSVIGVGAGGNLFKLAARQLAKLIPIAGSAINATVAYSGTYAMGQIAVQHYIHGVDLKKLKKKSGNIWKNDKF